MAGYPRAELEEMVERWLLANRDAEVAGLFLFSEEASWVTGQIFNADGGQVFR